MIMPKWTGSTPKLLHHRQQDRGADEDRRGHVEQAAEHQQQDVDQHQDDVFVVRHGQERGGDLRRRLHQRHHVADRGGEGDQRHHHRHRAQRAMHEAWQIAPAKVAVDEHGDEERPDAGDRARFDRGEDAGQNAAENDEEGDHAPERRDRHAEGGARRDRFAGRVAVAIGDDETEDDQRKSEQEPGHHPGQEQAQDRDRAAGGQRIDDRVMARRDQKRLHRGAHRHVGREDARIAGLLHLRDHDRTDRGNIGDGGTGDAGEECRRDDVDHRQAPAQAKDADERVGEGDQPPGHAALGHDRAGEHEERDGQHREFRHPRRDLQHDRFRREVNPPGRGERRKPERVGDRHADGDAAEQRAYD